MTEHRKPRAAAWLAVATSAGVLLSCDSGVAQDDWQSAYQVGEAVELKINDVNWQQCTVSENPPGGTMRADCEEYVEPLSGYSRAGGVYIVYGPTDLRRPGDMAAPAASPAPEPPPSAGETSASSSGGLRIGEYACYGSGGQILAGFGFTVLPGGRFTDLEGGNAGTYTVSGDAVTFSGGHLDGTVGRALNNGTFRIGQQATCEPF